MPKNKTKLTTGQCGVEIVKAITDVATAYPTVPVLYHLGKTTEAYVDDIKLGDASPPSIKYLTMRHINARNWEAGVLNIGSLTDNAVAIYQALNGCKKDSESPIKESVDLLMGSMEKENLVSRSKRKASR